MRAISTSDELINHLKKLRIENKSIGLIPTMGALHDGHFKLIEKCSRENDVTVISIFVNPIQFNNQQDLVNYPRTVEDDLDHLERYKVDFVFMPDEAEMYPLKPLVKIDFGKMGEVLEGKFRKGHFDGVGVVVCKLLNIIQPSVAYFGMKDLQQYLLIKRMSHDLNFQSRIVGVETVRDSSGLALSSRNRRLSIEGLKIAANIYRGLQVIKDSISNGKSILDSLALANTFYTSINGLEIEYLEAVNGSSFESVSTLSKTNELAVCVAGYVEGIRLIDNLYLRLK